MGNVSTDVAHVCEVVVLLCSLSVRFNSYRNSIEVNTCKVENILLTVVSANS